MNALESCRELFDRYGGHAQAAGFQLPTHHIVELRQRLSAYARQVLDEKDLQPRLDVDVELRLSDLDDEIYRQMECLSPFGTANPQPILAARDITVIAEPRILKGKHLKFRVEQDGKSFDAVGWKFAESHPQILQNKSNVSLAFPLTYNAYQGMTAFQLNVKDIHAQ